MCQKVTEYFGFFLRKFVAQLFHISPNLVTLCPSMNVVSRCRFGRNFNAVRIDELGEVRTSVDPVSKLHTASNIIKSFLLHSMQSNFKVDCQQHRPSQ